MPALTVFKSDAARARFVALYDARVRAWPVPCVEIEVATRFGTTHVIASGPPDAPAVVLLGSMMATATVWRANVEALSRHSRVYAVDIIGEPNKSVPSRRIFTRLGYAGWLSEVLDGLHIDRAALVGNSYGGYLAMNQASLTPTRVDRVILINPAAVFVQMWSFYWHVMRHDFLPWIENGVAIDPLDANWGDLVNLARTEGRPVSIVFPRVFGTAELRSIRVPTLLLIGEKEVIYPPESTVRRALERMPGLKTAVIAGANHMAALTKADAVNAQIIGFLRGGVEYHGPHGGNHPAGQRQDAQRRR